MVRLFGKLKKLEKLFGEDNYPFDIPLGPKEGCLSANQVVSFIGDGEKDPNITRHLESCQVCRDRVNNCREIRLR